VQTGINVHANYQSSLRFLPDNKDGCNGAAAFRELARGGHAVQDSFTT
jgi:hypothetical protein